MVRRAVKRIIVHIDISCGLDKLHLVVISHLSEDLHRSLHADLMSAERHVCIHDLPHPRRNPVKVGIGQDSLISLDNRAEIAF